MVPERASLDSPGTMLRVSREYRADFGNAKAPTVRVGRDRGSGDAVAGAPVRVALWFVAICMVGGTAARGSGPEVSIAGGPDATGQNYEWTLSNEGRSTILEVRIPHYRAALFVGPPGWTTDASTFLVNVGVADRRGECIARAPSERDGIAPGKSAVFRMQLAAAGAVRGIGGVHVRLADGREIQISGVAVPVPESMGDKYVSLIGLGGIFGVLILLQRLRRTRRRSVSA